MAASNKISTKFPPIENLAPDLNIGNFYKNLATIEERRKKWESDQQPRATTTRRRPSEVVASTRRVQRLWNKLQQRRGAWRRLSEPTRKKKQKQRKVNFIRSQKNVEDKKKKGIIERVKKGKIVKIKRLNLHKREILPHHYRKAHIDLPWPWRMYVKLMDHRKEYKFIEDEEVTYSFTQRERSIHTPMDAVFSIHLLEVMASEKVAPTIMNKVPCCYYSVVGIGTNSRASRIVAGRKVGRAKLDLTVHIGFTVSPIRSDPNNILTIDVWCFQDPEAQFVVGETQCHVYELINLTHSIQKLPMWVDGIYTGWLAFEFAFAYGSLGYGFSNQLRSTRDNANDIVSNSMFPRIRLQKETEKTFEEFETLMPQNIKIMDVENLMQEIVHIPAQINNGTYLPQSDRVQPISLTLEQVYFVDGLPNHCIVHDNIYQKNLKLNFNDTYGEYISLRHRKDRVAYLHDLVHGNQNDIAEDDLASLLFSEDFNEQEEETICDDEDDTVRIGGKYIYPRPGTRKCKEYNQIDLGSDDESFLDKFPALPRQQGYLDMLFGYTKATPEIVLTQTDNPLPKKVKVRHWASDAIIRFFKRIWYYLCLVVDVYAFFKQQLGDLWILYRMHCFPRIKYKKFVTPVIAVTLPSAPESLTKIQCYFADDPRERDTTDVMKLVERTTALISNDNQGELDQAEIEATQDINLYTGTTENKTLKRGAIGNEEHIDQATLTVINQIKHLFLNKPKDEVKVVANTVGSVMSLYNRAAHDGHEGSERQERKERKERLLGPVESETPTEKGSKPEQSLKK